jgi:hypothetical protein
MFNKREGHQDCEILAAEALAKLLCFNKERGALELDLAKIEQGFNLHEKKRQACPVTETNQLDKLKSIHAKLVDKELQQKQALRLYEQKIQQARAELDKAVAALRQSQGKAFHVVRKRDEKLEQTVKESIDLLSALDTRTADAKSLIQKQCSALSDALKKETYDAQDVYGEVEQLLPRIKQHQMVAVSDIRKQLKTRTEHLNDQIVTRTMSSGLLDKIMDWFYAFLGYEKPMVRLQRMYSTADDVHIKFATLCDAVDEIHQIEDDQPKIQDQIDRLKQDEEAHFNQASRDVCLDVVAFMQDRKPRVVRNARDAMGARVMDVADRVITPEKFDRLVEQSARMGTTFFQNIDTASAYVEKASAYTQKVLTSELSEDYMCREIPSPPPEPEVLTRPDSVRYVAKSLSDFLAFPTPTNLYRLEQVMKQYPEFYEEEPEFQASFEMAVALYPDELGVAFIALQAKVQGAVGKLSDKSAPVRNSANI